VQLAHGLPVLVGLSIESSISCLCRSLACSSLTEITLIRFSFRRVLVWCVCEPIDPELPPTSEPTEPSKGHSVEETLTLRKNVWFAFALGLFSFAGSGESDAVASSGPASPEYRYKAIETLLPAGFLILEPVAITEDRRVYGTGWACDEACNPSVVVYRQGRIDVLHDGVAYSANDRGTVGGSVITDADNFVEQAALFDNDGSVQLLPRRAGEYTSHVRKVTNSGIALVESVAAGTYASSFYLYMPWQATIPLNLGPDPVYQITVNDWGTIAATASFLGPNNDRAFRFNPFTERKTWLAPILGDYESWSQGINNRGDVLGYSFVGGGVERIGSWDGDKFEVAFVEGTPQVPTISNKLLWNEAGLIVITSSFNDQNSYIVPRPGVRKNLAQLSDHLDSWTNIVGLNERGDIVGIGGSSFYNIEHVFILERVNEGSQ